ncbi:hypothetical protein FHR47_002296 [Xanthomonas arboricola]|nr:hypothetical protein [Xanthomonas cannabis]
MSWPVPSKLARQIHAILIVRYGMWGKPPRS